jgi:YD repeat-containing protein
VKVEYFSRGQSPKRLTKKKGHMKSILLSIVCALAAPLAFAQVSTTTTEQTTTQPATTTTTYTVGTVATYEPSKTVVVKSDEGPVSFALGTTAHIVNGAGQVVTTTLRPGEHVRVYYTGTGNTRVVERVVVEE